MLAPRSAAVIVEMGTTATFPPELIDSVIEAAYDDEDYLRLWSAVNKAHRPTALRHLLHTVRLFTDPTGLAAELEAWKAHNRDGAAHVQVVDIEGSYDPQYFYLNWITFDAINIVLCQFPECQELSLNNLIWIPAFVWPAFPPHRHQLEYLTMDTVDIRDPAASIPSTPSLWPSLRGLSIVRAGELEWPEAAGSLPPLNAIVAVGQITDLAFGHLTDDSQEHVAGVIAAAALSVQKVRITVDELTVARGKSLSSTAQFATTLTRCRPEVARAAFARLANCISLRSFTMAVRPMYVDDEEVELQAQIIEEVLLRVPGTCGKVSFVVDCRALEEAGMVDPGLLVLQLMNWETIDGRLSHTQAIWEVYFNFVLAPEAPGEELPTAVVAKKLATWTVEFSERLPGFVLRGESTACNRLLR